MFLYPYLGSHSHESKIDTDPCESGSETLADHYEAIKYSGIIVKSPHNARETQNSVMRSCVQVERVLRQRASSVLLHPEIEEVCRSFLHLHCTTHTGPGQEIGCLQVT